jgi:hypothetical protein
MVPITSHDVIGRSWVEIFQSWRMNPEEGLDFAWSYMPLDNGPIIALRFESIVAESMPADALRIVHASLLHVYGQRIERALLAPTQSDWYHETKYALVG